MKLEIDNDFVMLILAMQTTKERHQKEKGDSWKTCDMKFLEDKLCEEFKEWFESKKKHELVDIALICMMLFNRKLLEIWREK